MALGGQHRQEGADLLRAQVARMAHRDGFGLPADQEADPIEVSLLGAYAIVFVAKHLADLVQQAQRLGDRG